MNWSFLLLILLTSTLMALLYIILKYFQKFKINNIHGLTFNYITAALFSFLNDYPQTLHSISPNVGIIKYAFLTGSLFIVVFYVAALTAQHVGITTTSIAGKMSMIIPIAGGILLFHDQLNFLRIAGILTALSAVFLSSMSSGSQKETSGISKQVRWILPVLLFLGSGLVDFSIKLSEHYLINDTNRSLYISLLFGSAGCIGTLLTLFNFFKSGIRLHYKSVLGGILLGLVNFYSLDFLITVLSFPHAESSVVFALTNVFVVLISVGLAMLLFREKISNLNTAGIGIALLSIYILSR